MDMEIIKNFKLYLIVVALCLIIALVTAFLPIMPWKQTVASFIEVLSLIIGFFGLSSYFKSEEKRSYTKWLVLLWILIVVEITILLIFV